MNTDNAIKSAIGFFIVILTGSLLVTIIGGGFGARPVEKVQGKLLFNM